MSIAEGPGLEPLRKLFGLRGRFAQDTRFDDGNLSQVVEVSGAVRRGKTIPVGGGMFYIVGELNHAAGNQQQINFTPYAQSGGNKQWYNNPIPDDVDLWLYGAALYRTSGGAFTAGALWMELATPLLAYGLDQGASAHSAAGVFTLAYWDTVNTDLTLPNFCLTTDGRSYVPIGIRLPKAITTQLHITTVSGAAAVFEVHLLMGYFPRAAGQDGAI